MRTSFEEMFAQADATLEDNTTGNISPSDVRGMIRQVMETIQPGYAAFQITTERQIAVNSTTPVTIGAWDSTVILTPDFSTDQGNGLITLDVPGVCEIQGEIRAQFTNNTINLIANSSQSAFTYETSISSGGGGNRPQAGSVFGLYDVGTTAADFTLSLLTDGANENVTISYALFLCKYVPLRNAPV